MNLQNITAGYVAAVNPTVPCILKTSNGTTTTNPDFSLTPNYNTPVTVMGQVQALQFRDIQQLEGLNLQGTRRAIYLQGDVEGLVRTGSKGGDIVTFPDGTVWLVAMVLEAWGMNANTPGEQWCKVAGVLQNGA
jgi:hypothetical protein